MSMTATYLDTIVELMDRVKKILGNPYSVSLKSTLLKRLEKIREDGVGTDTDAVTKQVQDAENFLVNIELAYNNISEMLEHVREHAYFGELNGRLRKELDDGMPEIDSKLYHNLDRLKGTIEFATGTILPRIEKRAKFDHFLGNLKKRLNWALTHWLFEQFISEHSEWKTPPILAENPTREQIDEAKRFVDEFQAWIDSGVQLLHPSVDNERSLRWMGLAGPHDTKTQRPKKPGSSARRVGQRETRRTPYKKGQKNK